MAKTTFTVPEVPGSKRVSERTYTHAVIGRYDPAVSAATAAGSLVANETKCRRWDGKRWDDEKRASQAIVGQLYLNHNGFMVEARDYNVELGQKFVAENPDRQAYIERESAERRAHVERLKQGKLGDIAVLQWSMSHKNAMKAISSWAHSFSGLRVVPCVPVEKPAKA